MPTGWGCLAEFWDFGQASRVRTVQFEVFGPIERFSDGGGGVCGRNVGSSREIFLVSEPFCCEK